MRKLIVSNVMSLEGFGEGPEKDVRWFPADDEFFDYAKQMLRAADILLFGRVTYEHMAAYWPSAPKDEIADKMNSLPKLVASRTLEEVPWNNSKLIKGDVAEEIAKLKKREGKDIVLLGSPILASGLLQQGLIDEYRVILAPVLIGSGSPLFKDIRETVRLKLEKTKVLKSGVTLLYYDARRR
ncbi:MAG TPA: dihydrofolate reductase family protein [Verrucomicrobiae bacterium]|nr:dihydrofolate reductase family protein [Verrucomicrobiae bacterium]